MKNSKKEIEYYVLSGKRGNYTIVPTMARTRLGAYLKYKKENKWKRVLNVILPNYYWCEHCGKVSKAVFKFDVTLYCWDCYIREVFYGD